MDPIFLVIVIALLVLAAIDLTVGVSNDAVNFLNSSIGSKAAPMWVILTLASIGVMFGALFSNGMMDIARHGVFNPEMFTFRNVMMLFLSVMITDVVLLDVYNTYGLPTSTTVSLVSGLLGSAVGVALYSISQNGGGNLVEYLNTSKVLGIFSAILVSVAVAFLSGSLIQYISRAIFSFNYQPVYRYIGFLFAGSALTAITYFVVFKGLKGSTFMTEDNIAYLNENLRQLTLYTFLGWSALLAILQYAFRVNTLKVIILAGTLALSLAFASNDLVNFIGVFMAGLSSYEAAQAFQATGGDVTNMTMETLKGSAMADWRWLGASGLIMVLALWFSKKSRTVTKTEIGLARQGEGLERFDSSPLSRSVVRMSVSINKGFQFIFPESVRKAIDKRFIPLEVEDKTVSFDLIRASVNLTLSALLISLGTSLKLPLSTTYVTFMVAMGTSLSDRAWGRESAVYRINGVLTVIGGWFITAFAAFTLALIFSSILVWGGKIAVFALLAFVVFLFIKSASVHKKRETREASAESILNNELDIIRTSTEDVKESITKMLEIYDSTIEGLTQENLKSLKTATSEAEQLYTIYKDKRTYEVVPTIQAIAETEFDIEQDYVQIVDYTYEISKALQIITKISLRHIDNNHKGLTPDQSADLHELNAHTRMMFENFLDIINNAEFETFKANLVRSREDMLDMYAKLTKKQIKRVKMGECGTRCSILFLNILNETKNITLQAINMMKAQRDIMFANKKPVENKL